ncbi:hypothetical protein Bbelb_190850 [Branchiostoma belcheri]|nr:hypothetical protein Bbelb_190850 [Branchiostoma belcheri]
MVLCTCGTSIFRKNEDLDSVLYETAIRLLSFAANELRTDSSAKAGGLDGKIPQGVVCRVMDTEAITQSCSSLNPFQTFRTSRKSFKQIKTPFVFVWVCLSSDV